MNSQMITDTITTVFNDQVGKWQVKKPEQRALKISFRTRIDHATEEGYRFLDLLIYGPMNYVGVFIRERATVISHDDMEEGDDGEMVPKEGKDYSNVTTDWVEVCYHDSGWRSAVNDVLFQNRDKITGFDCLGGYFYQSITVPEEIQKIR